MKNIKVETKSNGYKAEGIQSMIGKFEKAAAQLFPGCTVRHFYYGDSLDMADVVLEPGRYAHFNVTAKRVSLCGYTCSSEDLEKEAHAIFREHYPDRTPGTLNCSDYYTEAQFKESDMLSTGNRGAFCHRKLSA